MRHNVEYCRGKAGCAAETDAHIDIADLRRGGKGHHTVDIIRADRRHRAEDHTAEAKDKYYVADRHLSEYVDTDHAPVYFDQKENIALGHQGRQDRR